MVFPSSFYLHFLNCGPGRVAVLVYLLVYGGQYWSQDACTTLQSRSHQVLASQTWVVILVISILVGLILAGIIIIFVYNQKLVQLYRLQHNFINNFTHELKTPVTSLKLYLETFLKHDLSRDDQLKYIHYMIQDADRLSDNTTRILNLARIESRNYEGEFVISDLVQTVEGFCSNNSYLFGKCEITIQNPSGRSFPYRINPSLFEMLLMNLLTNAIKYNESEIPKVDITFELQKRRLYICLEDNGIGIKKGETVLKIQGDAPNGTFKIYICETHAVEFLEKAKGLLENKPIDCDCCCDHSKRRSKDEQTLIDNFDKKRF